MPPAPLQVRTFGMRRVPPPPAVPEPPAFRPTWHFVPQWRVVAWRRFIACRDSAMALLALLQRNEARRREASVRKTLQSDSSATFVRLLAYLAGLALLAIVGAEVFRSPPVGAAIDSAPPPAWTTVAKPFPAFALSMPELLEGPHGYIMRRHGAGGGRKDVFTWGELSGASPHLMVEIYRPGSETTRFEGVESEIAAKTDGLVSATAVKPAGALESKFGPVSLAEFSIPGDAARQCLGFSRSFDKPLLQISGIYCWSGSGTDVAAIACALDRLNLLSAASDTRIGELFARAELKRNFCGQRSPILAATPKLGPPSLLGPETRLRGTVSAR